MDQRTATGAVEGHTTGETTGAAATQQEAETSDVHVTADEHTVTVVEETTLPAAIGDASGEMEDTDRTDLQLTTQETRTDEQPGDGEDIMINLPDSDIMYLAARRDEMSSSSEDEDYDEATIRGGCEPGSGRQENSYSEREEVNHEAEETGDMCERIEQVLADQDSTGDVDSTPKKTQQIESASEQLRTSSVGEESLNMEPNGEKRVEMGTMDETSCFERTSECGEYASVGPTDGNEYVGSQPTTQADDDFADTSKCNVESEPWKFDSSREAHHSSQDVVDLSIPMRDWNSSTTESAEHQTEQPVEKASHELPSSVCDTQGTGRTETVTQTTADNKVAHPSHIGQTGNTEDFMAGLAGRESMYLTAREEESPNKSSADDQEYHVDSNSDRAIDSDDIVRHVNEEENVMSNGNVEKTVVPEQMDEMAKDTQRCDSVRRVLAVEPESSFRDSNTTAPMETRQVRDIPRQKLTFSTSEDSSLSDSDGDKAMTAQQRNEGTSYGVSGPEQLHEKNEIVNFTTGSDTKQGMYNSASGKEDDWFDGTLDDGMMVNFDVDDEYHVATAKTTSSKAESYQERSITTRNSLSKVWPDIRADEDERQKNDSMMENNLLTEACTRGAIKSKTVGRNYAIRRNSMPDFKSRRLSMTSGSLSHRSMKFNVSSPVDDEGRLMSLPGDAGYTGVYTRSNEMVEKRTQAAIEHKNREEIKIASVATFSPTRISRPYRIRTFEKRRNVARHYKEIMDDQNKRLCELQEHYRKKELEEVRGKPRLESRPPSKWDGTDLHERLYEEFAHILAKRKEKIEEARKQEKETFRKEHKRVMAKTMRATDASEHTPSPEHRGVLLFHNFQTKKREDYMMMDSSTFMERFVKEPSRKNYSYSKKPVNPNESQSHESPPKKPSYSDKRIARLATPKGVSGDQPATKKTNRSTEPSEKSQTKVTPPLDRKRVAQRQKEAANAYIQRLRERKVNTDTFPSESTPPKPGLFNWEGYTWKEGSTSSPSNVSPQKKKTISTKEPLFKRTQLWLADHIKKMETARAEKEKQEVGSCTFHPDIRNDNSLGSTRSVKSRNSSMDIHSPPEGYDEFVERMNHAHALREYKNKVESSKETRGPSLSCLDTSTPEKIHQSLTSRRRELAQHRRQKREDESPKHSSNSSDASLHNAGFSSMLYSNAHNPWHGEPVRVTAQKPSTPESSSKQSAFAFYTDGEGSSVWMYSPERRQYFKKGMYFPPKLPGTAIFEVAKEKPQNEGPEERPLPGDIEEYMHYGTSTSTTSPQSYRTTNPFQQVNYQSFRHETMNNSGKASWKQILESIGADSDEEAQYERKDQKRKEESPSASWKKILEQVEEDFHSSKKIKRRSSGAKATPPTLPAAEQLSSRPWTFHARNPRLPKRRNSTRKQASSSSKENGLPSREDDRKIIDGTQISDDMVHSKNAAVRSATVSHDFDSSPPGVTSFLPPDSNISDQTNIESVTIDKADYPYKTDECVVANGPQNGRRPVFPESEVTVASPDGNQTEKYPQSNLVQDALEWNSRLNRIRHQSLCSFSSSQPVWLKATGSIATDTPPVSLQRQSSESSHDSAQHLTGSTHEMRNESSDQIDVGSEKMSTHTESTNEPNKAFLHENEDQVDAPHIAETNDHVTAHVDANRQAYPQLHQDQVNFAMDKESLIQKYRQEYKSLYQPEEVDSADPWSEFEAFGV